MEFKKLAIGVLITALPLSSAFAKGVPGHGSKSENGKLENDRLKSRNSKENRTGEIIKASRQADAAIERARASSLIQSLNRVIQIGEPLSENVTQTGLTIKDLDSLRSALGISYRSGNKDVQQIAQNGVEALNELGNLGNSQEVNYAAIVVNGIIVDVSSLSDNFAQLYEAIPQTNETVLSRINDVLTGISAAARIQVPDILNAVMGKYGIKKEDAVEACRG